MHQYPVTTDLAFSGRLLGSSGFLLKKLYNFYGIIVSLENNAGTV